MKDTPGDDVSSRYDDFFRFGSGEGVKGRSSFEPRKLEDRPRVTVGTLEDSFESIVSFEFLEVSFVAVDLDASSAIFNEIHPPTSHAHVTR